jgi:hypothetical protein
VTRRQLLAAAGGLWAPSSFSKSRSFWVLKLLQPRCLLVRPVGTVRLHCSVDQRQSIVEGPESLAITPDSGTVCIAGPTGGPVHCVLEIPSVFRRSYFGTFKIVAEAGVLIPVVTMDCQVATGSVVDAELIVSGAPHHALAAQAVAARSMICAPTAPRHKFADFCDTTHCQFLRSPVYEESPSGIAASATRGLVLLSASRVVAARYSAACGGTTQAALDGEFAYVSVACEICRSANGVRRGHGLGLCQAGAIGLARLGWSWRDILRKYYPNAGIGPVSMGLP